MRWVDGLRQNLGLKVLSVALALLLWAFVHGAKLVEHEIALPVRCVNLPDSLLLQNEPPRTARVLVSGAAQEFVLRHLLPGAELRLDLARARPPVVRVTPVSGDVQLGSGSHLNVVRVLEPATFELGLDRRVERRLPVRVAAQGVPARGYVVQGAPRALPETVRCVGPAARFAGVREVVTERIDLAGRKESFDTRATLEAPGNGLRCEPAEVRVEVPIARDAAAVPGSPEPAGARRKPAH